MSGGAVAIENLSNAIAARGVDVEHVSIRPGQREPEFPTWTVVKHERLQARPRFKAALPSPRHLLRTAPFVPVKALDRWYYRHELRERAKSWGPDTVVVFTHVLSARVLRESGWRRPAAGPVLIGQHHSQFESLDHEPWLRESIPTEFADVDAFTALTDEDAAKFGSILSAQTYGVANPMGPRVVASSGRRGRVAIALARLSGEKQLDLMVRAFAAATRQPHLADWELRIYGDGPERSRVACSIAAANATDRIHLMGRTDDPATALSQSAVLLLTSSYEGLPVSILEASAAGVPTIAFDCSPGVRSLVPMGTGILVAPQDEDAYTHALSLTLPDTESLVRMGDHAIKHAEHYTPAAITDRWAEIITHCYADRSSSEALM